MLASLADFDPQEVHPDYKPLWEEFQSLYTDPEKAKRFFWYWLQYNRLDPSEPWPTGFTPKGSESSPGTVKEQARPFFALYTYKLSSLHEKEDVCDQYEGAQGGSPLDLPAFPPLHINCHCFIEEDSVEIPPGFFQRGNWPRLVELGFNCHLVEAQQINPHSDRNTPALSQNTEKRAALDRMKDLGLVPFEIHAKLAVPTVSGNKRKWTETSLKQNIPHWIGKPVMLDHSQGVGDVVARTMDAFWGPSRVREEDTVDALRAYSFGIMDATLFEKLRTDGKNVIGVPLVKGLSIGGGAELEYDEEGNEVPFNFIPEEYSITPFPGIKEAEIETMVPIMESLRSRKREGLKQRLIESAMPEFIPVFLIPLRGEACPEGYEKDTVANNCVIPKQMAQLPANVQEYLRNGATGHTLITTPDNKPLIYVSKEWVQQALKAVDETGRPPKEWWDDCIDGVTKSGSANDPAAVSAVSGHVWFHVLGEWARTQLAEVKKAKIELSLPAKTQAQFDKLYEKLAPDKIEIQLPENLFMQTTKETMTMEERKAFEDMIMDMERQRRGLPPLHEEEHGMIEPDSDGSCPEGYEKGEDGMCHLKMSKGPDPQKEAVIRRKIVEQLEKEVDEHKEALARVDVLRKERDTLKHRLQEQATMFKALEEGRRLPIPTGKGKALTQRGETIATAEIQSIEDSDALYKHFMDQGYSRNDAAKAVIYTMMQQAGLA